MFRAALKEIFRSIKIEIDININRKIFNNLRFTDNIIFWVNRKTQLRKLPKGLNKQQPLGGDSWIVQRTG